MKNLYIILFLIVFQSINAQVLWSDDFDNHPVGLLSNDPTGATPGYGGWYVENAHGQIQIVPESGRGYMMAVGWVGGTFGSTHEQATQESIDVLWNTRNKSNNILKLEFEVQATNNGLQSGSYFLYQVAFSFKNTPGFNQFSAGADKTTVPYNNSWIKVEIFIDYNTNTFYQYIPGYSNRADKKSSIGEPYQLMVSGYFMSPNTPSLISFKLDNMKISAIPALPSYLNVDEFLASKFNVFPNPATDVVIITNKENIGVEQIEVYDINGKNVKSQNYNHKNEIQLNISDLAVGTYMFHVKTNLGTAVKKVVKK